MSTLHSLYRMFRNQRPLVGITVGTLAIGMAVAAAVFAVADQALLRPLPFPDPERLVIAWNETGGNEQAMISVPDYLDLRSRLAGFEQFAVNWANGMDAQGKCLIGRGAEAESVRCAGVSFNFFAALGMKPMLGRDFVESDERASPLQAVILSHGYWKRRFQVDPSIIGRPILVDGATARVIGVMPAGLDLPEHSALWTPAAFNEFFRSEKARGLRYIHPFGRLKQGISIRAAEGELRSLMPELPPPPSSVRMPWRATLLPLQEALVRETRPGLRALLAASILLLLILTFNAANLILTATLHRRPEFAMRVAMGASPGHLCRQLLAECLMISVVSGLLAMPLAYGALRVLLSAHRVELFRGDRIAIGIPTLAYVFVVCVLVGLVSAVTPILTIRGIHAAGMLKESGRARMPTGRRIASLLVVAEIALAALLLPAAFTMLLGFLRLQRVDPGFDPRNVITMSLAGDFETQQDIPQTLERMLDRLRQLPSVEGASVLLGLPLRGWRADMRFRIDGESQVDAAAVKTAHQYRVSQEYFQVLRIPLLAGVSFPHNQMRTPPIVMVSQEFVRRYLSGRQAIGQRIRPEGSAAALEIIGIVGDVRGRSLDQAPYPTVYTPSLAPYDLAIRCGVNPLTMVPTIRAAIQSVDPEKTVSDVATMEDVVRASLSRRRSWSILLMAFSILSLAFSMVGVHGLISQSVKRRLPEFGIRAALGASPGTLLGMVARQTLVLISVGIGLGLAGYAALSPLLVSLLYEVEPRDPLVLAAVAALIFLASLPASLQPARWAMTADPAALLRVE
ncbi:MAG: ABC transporter permease [Acidobacteria bacterium]|nr:ABC transporter permease [Acidobacteriota bacterium]